MINTFKISFKLKITYGINGIIYSLKQVPLLKRLLPSQLYKSRGLKTFAMVLSILKEILGIFLGKALYLVLMIGLPLAFYKGNSGEVFLHIFTFLTISGAVMNTHMFNPTKDKYYALFLLRMDARKYTLSNYYYFLIKTVLGFLPLLIIFGGIEGISLGISVMMAIFVIAFKSLYNGFLLFKVESSKRKYNENKLSPVRWTIIIALLLGAYGLPFFHLVLPKGMLIALWVLTFILEVPALIYIHNFKSYRRVYKNVLSREEIIFDATAYINEVNKTSFESKIDNGVFKDTGKTGYAYFHEIFIHRHRKILTKSAKNTALVLAILVALAIGGVFYSSSFSEGVNKVMLTYLPYFVFIMYMINKGQIVTEAMFKNCDHSMLTYRFYRQPKAILYLFTKRLITLIEINLIPAMVLAVGLPTLLYISGGTPNPLNYLVLFLSIIFMSIFFSVHYLVLYYLMQPYNANLQIKNFTYSIITSATYVVAYIAIQVKLPTILFGTCIILFTVLYVAIALYLAYKYAPRTFKLR